MLRIFIPIIIIVTLLSYANSLHNQFIWDDEDWILNNSTIKDWHKWPELLSQNSIHGARKGSNFYRPLQAISHGIDYLIWKYSLLGHHIPNVIFHILAAILLMLLLARIFSRKIAFFSALLFAIHPVHTEAITYISGRADPMSAIFIFLTILLFEKNIILSCLAFIFAILSKESALITPFLIILYFCFKGSRFKLVIKRLLPFVFIIIIYGILRLTVLNFSHTIPENAPKSFFYIPFYIRLSTFFKTLPVYFKILLWPFGLHMERDISLAYSIFEGQSAFGFLIAFMLLFMGIRFRKRHSFLLFSSLWSLITIFPNSNIIPINALIYEHWLYIPSIGFFIVVVWMIERLFVKGNNFKIFSIILLAIISLFYAWRTFERNKDWHDPISFYESTLRYKSDSARLHNNLAMAYIDVGREEKAISEYKKAIESGDYYAQPHYNLSNIYLNRGDYTLAVEELERSLEIDNDFLYSHEKLSVIYFNQGKLDKAKRELYFLLEKEPENKIAIEILRKISKIVK